MQGSIQDEEEGCVSRGSPTRLASRSLAGTVAKNCRSCFGMRNAAPAPASAAALPCSPSAPESRTSWAPPAPPPENLKPMVTGSWSETAARDSSPECRVADRSALRYLSPLFPASCSGDHDMESETGWPSAHKDCCSYLSPLVQELDDLLELGLEAQVEQPVGLIQHQPAQLAGPEGLGVLEMVQQPAGAADQHRHALSQPGLLLVPTKITRTELGGQTSTTCKRA